MYGRGYVIEHCMEELERTFDERRYRAYVTDALMTLVNNVARSLGGSSFTARWVDGYKKQDPRTPEEIAQDVVRNAGLKPKGGEMDGFVLP